MCTRERPMWLHPWKLLFMVQKGKKTQPRGETPPSPLAFVLRRCGASKPGWEWEFQRLLKFNTNWFTARRLPIIYGLKA